MKILSLDISTNLGWALFDESELKAYDEITNKVENLDYKEPHANPEYPFNIIKTAEILSNEVNCLCNAASRVSIGT